MTRAASFALAAILVGGCYGGWRREYPPEWPRRLVSPADACPDVAGLWRGTAEEDPFAFQRAQLGALADAWDPTPAGSRDARTPRPTAARVRIAGPAGANLELANLAEDGSELARRVLRRGRDFECEDGFLVLFPPGDGWGNANVCVAKEWNRFALARDGSGALVVRKSERSLCLGLLGEAYFWSADWARFLAAPP